MSIVEPRESARWSVLNLDQRPEMQPHAGDSLRWPERSATLYRSQSKVSPTHRVHRTPALLSQTEAAIETAPAIVDAARIARKWTDFVQ